MRSRAEMDSLATEFTTFPTSPPSSIVNGSINEDQGIEQNKNSCDYTSPVCSQDSGICSTVTGFPLDAKEETTCQFENSSDEQSSVYLSKSLICDMNVNSTVNVCTSHDNFISETKNFEVPGSADSSNDVEESTINTFTSLHSEEKVNEEITPKNEDFASDSSNVLFPGTNTVSVLCSDTADQQGSLHNDGFKVERCEISGKVEDVVKEEIKEEEFYKADTEMKEEVEDRNESRKEVEDSSDSKEEVEDSSHIKEEVEDSSHIKEEVEDSSHIKEEEDDSQSGDETDEEMKTDIKQEDNLSVHSSNKDHNNLQAASESNDSNSSDSSNQDAVPSCSGTSSIANKTDLMNSSSESDDSVKSSESEHKNKKRKRDSALHEVLNVSDSDSPDEIDYSNLTPDQIKQLVEEARRLARSRIRLPKKCKCPKKKWSELPIVGPTKPSGVCNIGRGDWRIKPSVECANCAAGICDDLHPVRMKRRRRMQKPARSRRAPVPRPMGTIGQAVPVIELSDEENEEAPNAVVVGSEITVSSVSAEPKVNECIVLSSSEDDDDIVCEAVIKQPVRKVEAPEVVPNIPSAENSQEANRVDWSNIDLENFSDTLDLLGYLVDSPSATSTSTTDVPSSNVPCLTLNTPATTSSVQTEIAESQEVWTCPICLEPKKGVSEIMSTNCGHVFCGDCIRSAVKLTHKCPTCRKRLTVKQFHKIFL